MSFPLRRSSGGVEQEVGLLEKYTAVLELGRRLMGISNCCAGLDPVFRGWTHHYDSKGNPSLKEQETEASRLFHPLRKRQLAAVAVTPGLIPL